MRRTAASPVDLHRAVVLLRAVNVGGHGVLPMAAFAACLERLGYREPQTVLQSGNAVVVLPARPGPTARIESRIHEGLLERPGVDADVFVRTAAEWQAIVADNPYPEFAAARPSHMVAMVLRDTPAPPALERLRAAFSGPEQVAAGDRVLYISYPDGQGRSRLTGSLIERVLDTRGTARNWNTVVKLLALASAGPSHA